MRRAGHGAEANPTGSEDGHAFAGTCRSGIENRTHPRGNGAAEQRGVLEVEIGAER